MKRADEFQFIQINPRQTICRGSLLLFARRLQGKCAADQDDIVADADDVLPGDTAPASAGDGEEGDCAGDDEGADLTGDRIQLQIADKAQTAAVLDADDLLVTEGGVATVHGGPFEDRGIIGWELLGV